MCLGTADMIFMFGQIQERCIEQNVPVYILVDFTKALDTVNRNTMWNILRKLGCPDRFTSSYHQGKERTFILDE